MKTEEAIRHLGTYSTTKGSGQTTDKQHEESKQIAIKALEAIEKIKAEIKNYLEDEKYSDDGISDVGIGLELALNIIDRVVKEHEALIEEQKEGKWVSVAEAWMMEELENQIKEGKGCLGRDKE